VVNAVDVLTISNQRYLHCLLSINYYVATLPKGHSEQNGILGQRKHYNNTELNMMIMSKNSEVNNGHVQQVRHVSAILIHLIPIE
jgi:hypothetical protein